MQIIISRVIGRKEFNDVLGETIIEENQKSNEIFDSKFCEGFAKIKRNGKYEFIDKKGKSLTRKKSGEPTF